MMPASGASRGLVSFQTSGADGYEPLTSKHEGPEGAWKELAHRSRIRRLQKGVKAAALLLAQKFARSTGGRRSHSVWMITATYRPGAQHRPRHVSQLIKNLRDFATRRGGTFGYCWCMELTKAGVPHYHLVIWWPRGFRLPKADSAGWWPWGMTQTVRARSPVGYLIKYASKGDGGHSLPKGARMWGCGGLSLADRQSKSYALLPRYVQDTFNEGDRVKRCPGGGWISDTSGEWLEGVKLLFYGGRVWMRKRDAQI